MGIFSESYRPIEAGLFKPGKRTVLIVQNASTETRVFDPTQDNRPKPSRIELLIAWDFGDAAHVPARVKTIDPFSPIVLPPLSIARIVWK